MDGVTGGGKTFPVSPALRLGGRITVAASSVMRGLEFIGACLRQAQTER